MNASHQIVVSAENNPYVAWQCKLFYFSCVTRTSHRPVIIVHDLGGEWHPDFYELARAGCSIYSAPNHRFDRDGNDYACRNHPGSLMRAAELFQDEDLFLVLCDPDMVFVRQVDFPAALAGDFSTFMDYDRDFVSNALPKVGVTREMLDPQKESLCVGVPYVIPSKSAQELAETWMKAIEAFTPRRWEDVMYAFGLAVLTLGLKSQPTYLVNHNYWPEQPVTAPIIHYAYGDERWNKRDYFTDETNKIVWDPPKDYPPGTILGELLNQIKAARDFYRPVFV